MAVLVGKEVPDFKVKAIVDGEVKEDFTLSQFKGEKYTALFFYPLDFTFVCPTEMHAFQDKLKEFEEEDGEKDYIVAEDGEPAIIVEIIEAKKE